MSKYLVTGGAGFIGSHLVDRLLSEGHKVVVLDNFYTGRWENVEHHSLNDKFQILPGSILDKQLLYTLMGDIDAVIHLAAIVSIQDCENKNRFSTLTNFDATIKLLHVAIDRGVKKFIFASSSAVYGDQKVMPIKEGCDLSIISNYGVQKRSCEEFIDMLNYFEDKSVIYRFFNVYGPRQDPSSQYSGVISKFINNLLENKQSTIYGDGKQTRDFVYVEDLVRIISEHGLQTDKSGVYNIGTGIPTSIESLYMYLASLMDSKSVNLKYENERQGDIKHSVADISKLMSDLKDFKFTSMESGLKKTINFYKEVNK